MKPVRWIGAFFAGFTGFSLWPREEMTAIDAMLVGVGVMAFIAVCVIFQN